MASTASVPNVFDMHGQDFGQPSASTIVDITREDEAMIDWNHPMTSCTFPSTITEVYNGSAQINNWDTGAVAGTSEASNQPEFKR